MITLGTKKEMCKIKDLPAKLIQDIEAMLHILDSNYGTDRNYFFEGGFVGIVGTASDFQKLFSDWNIDLKNDISEYSINICGYIKKLFIINPDFAIVVYIKEDLL